VSYDRRTRDRYREVVTGVTGAAGIGALTLTGGLMGLASGAQVDDQQPVPAEKAQARTPRAHKQVLRERPYVTRVTVRYITGGSAAPASGGTVTTAQANESSPQQTQPAPQPAPPPPVPPPAPSSGS
jgi:hypothetical protein